MGYDDGDVGSELNPEAETVRRDKCQVLSSLTVVSLATESVQLKTTIEMQ